MLMLYWCKILIPTKGIRVLSLRAVFCFNAHKNRLKFILMSLFHISWSHVFKSAHHIYCVISTMDFHADRAIWPLCDNTVITSRYHSSADKAIGAPGIPRNPVLPNLLSDPEQTIRRKRKERRCSQWKTTGCQRGHSTGRYLYVFVGSGFSEGYFFPVRGRRSGLFIHMRGALSAFLWV